MLSVSAWHLARRRHVDVLRPSFRLALWVVLLAGVLVAVTGDVQARVMTEQQPMKMAAAEALYDASSPASFSLFTIGSLDGTSEVWSLRLPGVLSFMATGSPSGTVEGVNDLQAAYQQRYGPGDYRPYIPLAYWSFRLMIGFGMLPVLLALLGLWLTRRGRLPASRRARWFWRAALLAVAFPLLANTFGWIFTELGRQPWVVFGLLHTADGVSPTVGAGHVVTSLVVLGAVYTAFAVIEIGLLLRFAKAGPPPPTTDRPESDEDEHVLSFAY
jgi:cytochrome bd ubiquinol oxidase subunit I